MILLLSGSTAFAADESGASPVLRAESTARPSANGSLHVEGAALVDEAGAQVQLRGVSTHGLTWFPDCIDETLFRRISEDWGCNLVRLAMYSSVYCGSEDAKAESLALIHRGIQAAVAADMYVIVDWHILEDSDPNINAEAAAEFVASISSEYAGCPNLIFEICNEPNGRTNWADVARYSDLIIPIIRRNMPQAVILVGTPHYDRILSDAILKPLDDKGVMNAKAGSRPFEGVTTLMTEHSLMVFLDDEEKPGIGTSVDVTIRGADGAVSVKGIVIGTRLSRNGRNSTQTIEILDYCDNWYGYLSILYDRIPTLPQTLNRDFGFFSYLWLNIAQRIARTARY